MGGPLTTPGAASRFLSTDRSGMLGRVADERHESGITAVPELRAPTQADLPALEAASRDPEINAHLPGFPRRPQDARHWLSGPGLRYVAVHHASVVGGLELHDVRPGTDEVSFWVLPDSRRRGVATMAVRTLADWALSTRGSRLELVTDIGNTPAQRVAGAAGPRVTAAVPTRWCGAGCPAIPPSRDHGHSPTCPETYSPTARCPYGRSVRPTPPTC